MRVIIAEKPSLARAIAAAIPGQHRRLQHHIECATGDVVCWCAGHVLEMAPPEDYAPELRSWTLDALPILPQRWRHRVSSPELVDSIRKLLARASGVVHAGDPDREGQLLVEEVLLHLGWQGPTSRLLVTDLTPDAIRRALGALEPNERYRSLYEAALARQRADWIYGLNLTRLCTLRAQNAGYRGGVVSVGRVQTPVLGLVVGRDREIERFVAKPFFAVEAVLRTAEGQQFSAEWAVGKEHSARVDSAGRLLERQLAAAVVEKVSGQVGRVVKHEQKPEVVEAPLPYSLAALQVDAGRQLGLSAARVLELAQRLYERQLLTYPRSDCCYLPEAQREQARGVLAVVREVAPSLADACGAAVPSRCGRAWADAKVTAHHAIIPTAQRAGNVLDPAERALYELVACRYVQQFLPAFEFLQTRVEVAIAGETFVASGRRVTADGWKAFEGRPSKVEDDEPAEDQEGSSSAPLPALALEQVLACPSARVLEKRTQPPKPFTDASLIQAMCGIARFVADPKTRKVLQAADGIGTPATRADIIERLFERRYLERRRKQIRSTAVGRALIDALPTIATTPDLTAIWETCMGRINDGQLRLDRFLEAVAGQLGDLVISGKAAGPLVLPQVLQTSSTRIGGAKSAPRARASGPSPRASKAAAGVARARS